MTITMEEGTMAKYTFEYMDLETDRWTQSRNWYHDRDTAYAEGERWLRMFMPNSKSTAIRVVPIAE